MGHLQLYDTLHDYVPHADLIGRGKPCPVCMVIERLEELEKQVERLEELEKQVRGGERE